MEEIKEILVGMQEQMNGMQGQMNGMQGQMNGMQGQINGLQGQMNNMQNSIENLQQGQNDTKKEIKQMDERLTKEVRAVNQRLAVFQEDIAPQINILFDADMSRQELLETHDTEICEIRQKQSEQFLRIERLEHKVIGA